MQRTIPGFFRLLHILSIHKSDLMTARKSTFLFFLTFLVLSWGQVFAQNESSYAGISATPKNALEIGLHGGHFFSAGDVSFTPSWGAGLHIRKALDYIFSLRFDAMYGLAQGDTEGSGIKYRDEAYTHETTYASGSLQGVITLNNLRWDKPRRKVNLYVYAGGGMVYMQTAIQAETFSLEDVEIAGRSSSPYTPAVEVGGGLAFRLGEGFNIGLEHKASTVFGKRTDLLDGHDTRWRDIANYTHLRLNINLLSGGKKSEPLYWINPLDIVLNDISELKARPVMDLTDTDKDGVIDLVDQENDTPPNAAVDTRGVTLDSDKDGIADYMDQEPYSPRGVAVDGSGVAQGTSGDFVTRDEVERMIQDALSGKGVGNIAGKGGAFNGGGGAVVEWFLPIIHFGVDSYNVRYSDYGNLASIARVLQANPGINLVVTGHTDNTASNDYNENLSYRRAQSAIDHLVNVHGIAPERLILQYGGEGVNLVPSSGSSLMNRRVEFRVATPNDEPMGPPTGEAPEVEDFDGTKSDGY